MDKGKLSVTILNRSNHTLEVLKEAAENKEFTKKMYCEMQRLFKLRKFINNAVLNHIAETFRHLVDTVIEMTESISNEVKDTGLLIDLTDGGLQEENKNEESDTIAQDEQLTPTMPSIPTHTNESESNNYSIHTIYQDQTFSDNNTDINMSMETTNNYMQPQPKKPTTVTNNDVQRQITKHYVASANSDIWRQLPKPNYRINQNLHHYRNHKKDKPSTILPYHAECLVNKTFSNFRSNVSELRHVNTNFKEMYKNRQVQNYNVYNQSHNAPSNEFTAQRMATNQTQETLDPNLYDYYFTNDVNYNDINTLRPNEH